MQSRDKKHNGDIDLFGKNNALINTKRGYILSLTFIMADVIIIIFDIIINKNNILKESNKIYFILYICFGLINLIYFLIFKKYLSDINTNKIHFSFCITNILCVSALSGYGYQFNKNYIVYIIIIFIFSAIFLYDILHTIFIYIPPMILLLSIIVLNERTMTSIFGITVEIAAVTVSAIFVSNMIYTARYESFYMSGLYNKANTKLNELIITDPLTGFYNKKAFIDYLNKQVVYGIRNKKQITLLLVEIDFFKEYCEKILSKDVESCIIRIAEILKRSAKRQTDTMARLEENIFAVIIPDSELNGSIFVANKIRKYMEEENIVHPASPISGKITLSIGMATAVPDVGFKWQDLLEAAQEQLDTANTYGKNKIEYIDLTV